MKMMNSDVVNLIKRLGVGCRHPKDEFFREGDVINKVHEIFGVYKVDDEDFCQTSYSSFSCHVPGCSSSFETVHEYEQHYNSCHRFSCSECKKYLPSSHLLDLHLMETHDAYFAAASEKKSMFQCYIQECREVFKTPDLRREHCISVHKFPSDFRFDHIKKKKNKSANQSKSKKSEKGSSAVNDTGVPVEDGEQMEVVDEVQKGKQKENRFKFQNVSFGHTRTRKVNMNLFVTDLKKSLES